MFLSRTSWQEAIKRHAKLQEAGYYLIDVPFDRLAYNEQCVIITIADSEERLRARRAILDKDAPRILAPADYEQES